MVWGIVLGRKIGGWRGGFGVGGEDVYLEGKF